MFQWSSTGLQVYGSRYEYFRWLSLAFGTKFMEGVEFVSGLMFGVVQILSAFNFLYCTQLLLISLPMCKTIMKPLMVRWCVAPPFGELWTMLNLNHKLISLMLLERYLLDPNRVNSRLWSSNSFSIWFFCFLSLQLLFLGLGPSVSLLFFFCNKILTLWKKIAKSLHSSKQEFQDLSNFWVQIRYCGRYKARGISKKPPYFVQALLSQWIFTTRSIDSKLYQLPVFR